jgi:hypothetical protein
LLRDYQPKSFLPTAFHRPKGIRIICLIISILPETRTTKEPNYRGGWLILGVSDQREIVGLTRSDNEERIQHLCYAFEPPLQVEVRAVTIQDRSVLVVRLVGNHDKPYAYQSQTRQIYYLVVAH